MTEPSALFQLRSRLERNLLSAVEDAVSDELSYSADKYVREMYDTLPGASAAMPCCGRPVWDDDGSAFEWNHREKTMACRRCCAVYRPGPPGEGT